MSSIIISGDTSGTVAIAAPAIAGTNTMTLAAGSGTLAPKVMATAVASTSGTAIDFTNIPSWVTRITVMFSGVSTNGTGSYILQLGTSGGIVTSGYTNSVSTQAGATNSATVGFAIANGVLAASNFNGAVVLVNLTGNTWVSSGILNESAGGIRYSAGSVSLSGTLTQIRLINDGSNTFDAGTINIMYE